MKKLKKKLKKRKKYEKSVKSNTAVIAVEDSDDSDDSKMKLRPGMNRDGLMCSCSSTLFKHVVVNMKINVFKKGKFYKQYFFYE